MLNKVTKESIQLVYVRWNTEDSQVCSQCGSQIRYLYNDGGRFVLTLTGKLKLFTCYYVCTNEKCTFATPFTLPHDIVLPYKHYGLDVWYFAITSHLKFHDAYSSIADRLKEYFALDISPNTVKAIIETFLVASSQEADQETARQVREAGRIHLALDGQKPNNGESGLWLFIDTITNRIVHLEYLKSASWNILAEAFQKIEKKYGVPIEAVISDHQKSIIKAVKEALPGVPHQFCHYHFLKNLHRTLNALDSHLHVQLAEAVSDLYICNLPQTIVSNALQKRGLDLRAWVSPIVNDLSSLIQEHTRDFDIFAGFNVYQHLTEYTDLLEQFFQTVKPVERLASLVEKTIVTLRRALKEQTALYLKLKVLLPLFHECRALLGATTPSKEAMRSQATRWQSSLQQLYKTLTGDAIAPDLKSKRISAETPLADIIAEWNRLFSTHKKGLFHYLKYPKLPRSNVALEKMFSLELHHFRTAFGKSQVGNLVRVKGGELCVVLQDYNPDVITHVLLAQDRKRIQEGRNQFRERHKQQANSWHTKKPRVPEICQLIENAKKLRAIS
jgi:hypothetical protein